MNEDIELDGLCAELASRNLPVCYRAIFAINALRGKKNIIPAPVVEIVEEPAPATLADAAKAQDA